VTKKLDLLDIQGNVVRAYGRFGYPVARYVFLNIRDGERGRDLIGEATRRVTSSVDWGSDPGQVPRPDWTLNLAFTYQGLKELGLPTASLITFSPEFVAGMKDRKDILGDDGPSSPQCWDPIWQGNRVERDKDVHVFVALNAGTPAQIEEAWAWLQSLVARHAGAAVILGGHRADDGSLIAYQDVHALLDNGKVCAKEHFGYTDGIGDPVFEGMPSSAQNPVGRGKPLADGTWAPLATGEFLLGHPDEAHEYPSAPGPVLLGRNGSYMVYRKLHQNVATFDAYLDTHGKTYPGGRELLQAKFVGRWADNGVPLALAPDKAAKAAFDARIEGASPADRDRMMCDFTYDEDMSGARCPFSAHARRVNPRGSLEMTRDAADPPGALRKSVAAFDTPGALSNRRRLLRRGLPYGQVTDPKRDDGEHGIVIMMVNADINRQFEFVQQQWVNYGNDFKAGNDKDIVLGNHSVDDRRPSKAVLQTDPQGDGAPYFLTKIPRFVETRGGDYFFVPSLTALRMIAAGTIDPT
jgi:Dyp-type peroxidase family